MKRGSPARLLLRQAEGRPDEAWLTLKLLVYFFLMMAAAYLILPIKVSSFLKKLDVGLLPVAYIITAVLMSFVAAFNSRLLQRLNRRRYFSASLVFFIASLVVFWELFRLGGKWVAMAFWFWAEAFLAVSVIQFWILVNLLYRPRQVKRFIGLFVGAGLLGGIAGSAIASLLSKRLGSENLLLVCPALLAMALAILLGLPEGPPAAASEKPAETREARKRAAGYMESLRTILGSRYLVTLSTMILVAFCVSKIIDFQFGQALKLHFPADNQQDQQTAYQGAFLMFLLIGSYVFHVLVTGRLLKRFGLRTALFVAPVVLAVGAFSGLFVPAGALLVWASILRGVDKSLAVSINQSTREILYIPVPVETKVKAKVFIDLFVSKFADVLAAIICLICYWI